MVTQYKIQRTDGLFSMGGEKPAFTKRGKTWQDANTLRNHLAQFRKEQDRDTVYKDCRVVVYKMIEDPEQSFDLAGILDDYRQQEVSAKLKGNKYW